MTWLVDARTLSSRPTGVGMYAYRLIKRLLDEEVKNSGGGEERKFVLVCDVKESAELRALEAAGCEVRSYGRRVFNSLGVIGYFRFVKDVVADARPDVFWQPNNLQPFRVKGVKRVIVTMHDVFGLGWSWRHWIWHLYCRLNFRRTLRNVTEIWYNSEQTKTEVHGRVGGDLSGWKERITHPQAEVPATSTIAPYVHERPFFLYLGNAEVRKGADLLIASYLQYRGLSARPHDLVVAGAERDVRIPDVRGVVRLGYVADSVKFSLMRACQALVVPSRAEGYGMQVAEALKLDVPLILSDLPVFDEVAAEEGASDRMVCLRGFREGTDDARVKLLREAMLDCERHCVDRVAV